jgi:hypothetical protein
MTKDSMRLKSLLLALLVVALAAPAAQANQQAMFSMMMDDNQLLYRGDDARDSAMKRMKGLGVDYVRVTVLWSVVAENAKFDRRGKKRVKFKADDPRTYPKGNWDRYDRLVQAGKALNLGIYFNVTGPGPSWAHKKPPKKLAALAATYKPKPREYFKFVKAVGKRYDGTYVDENDGAKRLPKVSFWSIYNEPNQPGWLTPQYEKRGSKVIPWSPVMYRELYYYGRAALQLTGHGGDIILAGETAPLGSGQQNPKSPIRPKKFIRELFCLNGANAKLTGSAAAKRQCKTLAKIGPWNYTAWGHHPYTKDIPPFQRDKNKDSITMANVGELSALLNTVGAKTGALSTTRNLTMMTEFGYESDPPDPFSGVPLDKQAEYINLGDFLAYKDPMVLGNTQFQLRDVEPDKKAKKDSKKYWFTYQSGLLYASGSPKPAANAYVLPLVITGKGTDSVGQDGVTFWGWLRFLPNGTQTEVTMQFKPAGAIDFSTIGDPVKVNSAFGFFEAHKAVLAAGTWRAVWTNPVTGTPVTSREVPFTP